MPVRELVLALALVAGAAVATAVIIIVLKPLLRRYALARPSARSSHSVPTPQGGGIGVVATVLIVIVGACALDVPGFRQPWALALGLSMVVLGIMGAVDDIRPQPVLPRLILQLAAAAALVLTLPGPGRVAPWLPLPIEVPLLVVGLVWFINLTNFMDGIDELTVAEMVPICAALAAVGATGAVPPLTGLMPITLAAIGALLGFAPFNRHVARLFLGDVGSLPIGALVGFLLLVLAAAGHLAAALILPLYYLADATITLLRRWWRKERVLEAHRSHFYQLATERGFSVPGVTCRVLGLNVVLALLAFWSVWDRSPATGTIAFLIALGATGAVLRGFYRGRA